MKKWILSMAAAILLLCMCVPVFAKENAVSVTDAAAEPGQTVFLTVRLNQSAVGDTLAISYDFDSKLLTAIPGSCKWERNGALTDFNNKKGGVWAATSAADLKGDICTLAFRINTGVSFQSTKVSCTVVVRSGNQDVGAYTSAAMVSMSCKHSTYGDWVRKDDLIHTSTCTQCGNVQSGTHKWDTGVEAPNPGDALSTLLTLTCQSCKATKVIVVSNSLSEPDGTKPQEKPTLPNNGNNNGATEPQEPECTDPNHNHGWPGNPVKPQKPSEPPHNDGSNNRPNVEQSTRPNNQIVTQPNHDGHDHGQITTQPNQSTQEDDHAGHDHSHDDEESDKNNWIVGSIVFVVAAGLVAGGVYLVMKKK